jgi:DNA-binding response OmpR family regulator
MPSPFAQEVRHDSYRPVSTFTAAYVVVLRENRFDVAILDQKLPDGLGLDILPKIAERCSRVIMLTSEADTICQRALSLGAEELFPKPIDLYVVKDCITKHI